MAASVALTVWLVRLSLDWANRSEWLESVPEEYRRRAVAAADIVFRLEAKAGDELESRTEIVKPDLLRHAIVRLSDGALLATCETVWRN